MNSMNFALYFLQRRVIYTWLQMTPSVYCWAWIYAVHVRQELGGLCLSASKLTFSFNFELWFLQTLCCCLEYSCSFCFLKGLVSPSVSLSSHPLLQKVNWAKSLSRCKAGGLLDYHQSTPTPEVNTNEGTPEKDAYESFRFSNLKIYIFNVLESK